MNILRFFLCTLACVFSVAASAQWQWIDKDGHKVFSDRGPPPDILQKNILKQPGNHTKVISVATNEDAVVPAQTVSNSAGAVNTPKIASGDKELEAKKKQATDAEAARRKADDEKLVKAKIENCARAKQAKTTFDSGVRVARTNASGEREIMDDAARAAEARRIQGIIATDCV
ncbi:MAG: hypothetical protein RIS34_2150 [Pseudomonadota bacterium]|jgi:hypothetical protein